MPDRNLKNRKNFSSGLVFAAKVGDLLESALDRSISDKYMVPVLEGDMEGGSWYRVPLEKGLSGDGSPYHIYVSRGKTDHLCLFFSGGGVAWNEFTAARPVTGAKMASREPNYYWDNLRPVTQLMNVNLGITNLKDPRNPFRDWSFVVITYATGDFHVGRSSFRYRAEDGEEKTLHFHGYQNYLAAMEKAVQLFPSPDRMLIAGNSAGAFAVPALSGAVVRDYYPDCPDITLFSDSGQLLYEGWQHTARELWKAVPEIWEPLHTPNITADWYEQLHREFGDCFRYLYGSSTRDFLLSTYYNDITNKRYETDEELQEAFRRQLVEMTERLLSIADFRFYFYDWKIPGITRGGTVHTAVREAYFTSFRERVNGNGRIGGHARSGEKGLNRGGNETRRSGRSGSERYQGGSETGRTGGSRPQSGGLNSLRQVTMAQWLDDQIAGRQYDVGFHLLAR